MYIFGEGRGLIEHNNIYGKTNLVALTYCYVSNAILVKLFRSSRMKQNIDELIKQQ